MPKRISPKEAHELVQQGWTYVDVRSEAEYEASHPAGAVNIPVMFVGPEGRTLNPHFADAFRAAFPVGSRVILGCAGGVRSMKAAAILEALGYDELIEQRAGFNGARDASGQVVEPGWQDCGLPCESGAPEGRCWKSQLAKI